MQTARAESRSATWHGPIPIRSALIQLGAAQKPGVGVPAYTRWINRGLARYASALAQRLRLTPNTVSAGSFIVSMAGIGCLLTLGVSSPMAGGLLTAGLLAAGYVLDSADGQLARLTNRQSLAGEWLDHSLDAIRMPAVHLGVLSAALMLGSPGLAIVAGVFSVTTSAHFLSQNLGGLLRDQVAGARLQPRRSQSWLLLPTDPGVLCWLFLLWPLVTTFSIAYTGLLILNLIHFAFSSRRRWSELVAADQERADR